MALNSDRIKPAEFARNVFAMTVPQGVTFEDVKKPEFYAHIAAKLHPTDHIEVTDDEGTFFAELFVVACARNWAKVSVLRFHELEESRPEADKEVGEAFAEELKKYKVDWTQNSKARVIRLTDKQVLSEQHASKAAAEKWLKDYITTNIALV